MKLKIENGNEETHNTTRPTLNAMLKVYFYLNND